MLICLIIQTQAITYEFIPTTKTPPPQIYASNLILTSSNELYVFGGISITEEFFDTIWKFDLETYLWDHIFLENPRKPPSRAGSVMLYNPYENEIILYGGSIETGPTDDQWVFKIDEKKWEELPIEGMDPIALAETSLACFYWSNEHWCAVLGGLTRSGYDYNLYIFDLLNKVWNKYEIGLEAYNFGQGHSLWYYEGFLYTYNSYEYVSRAYNFLLLRISLTDFSVEEIEYTNIPPSRANQWQTVYEDAAYYMPNYSFTNTIETSLWQLNLTTFVFKEVEVDLTEANEEAINLIFNGLALSEEIAYTYGGSGGTTSNTIFSWDFSQSPIKVTEISKNTLIPTERSGHTLAYCCGKLYMFGGKSPEGEEEFLNSLSELWIFDIESETWTLQSQNGAQPSGRAYHIVTYFGYLHFYFGGETSSGLSNEAWLYDTLVNEWSLEEVEGDKPSPRKGACVVQFNPYAYIFGGAEENSYSSELWRYELFYKTFELVSFDELPRQAFSSCRYVMENGNEYFQIDTGELEERITSEFVYKFNFETLKIESVEISESISRLFLSCSVSVGEISVFYGGRTYDDQVAGEIYEIEDFEETVLGTLEKIFDAACLYVKNYLYVVLGQSSNRVDGRLIWMQKYNPHIKKITHDGENWVCSPGTSVPDCEFCPMGTYNGDYNSTCAKCPKGTYSSSIGSNFYISCIDCGFGTYNDEEGASICKDCSSNFYCPTGSPFPIEYETIPGNSTEEPKKYEADKDLIEILNLTLILGLVFMFLLMLSLMFFVKKIRDSLDFFDLYDSEHNYSTEEPMYLKKNKEGGFFSIIFILSAIFIVLNTLIGFVLNNTIENKFLTPFFLLEEDYPDWKSDINIIVTIWNYRDECLYNTLQDLVLVKVEASSLIGESEITVEKIDELHCKVEISCEDCYVVNEGNIEISSSEIKGFGSHITVNVTASSSISDYISSSQQTITTSEPTYVLRGPNPSIFSYNLIPSIFDSEISGEKKTGYHIEENYVEKGSELYEKSLLNELLLIINIEFLLQTSALVTERVLSQSTSTVIGAVIGSVLGQMSFIGYLMKEYESRKLDRIEKCKKNTEKSQEVEGEFLTITENNSQEVVKSKIQKKAWGESIEIKYETFFL